MLVTMEPMATPHVRSGCIVCFFKPGATASQLRLRFKQRYPISSLSENVQQVD
jgi:hypothetical protein